MIRPPPRSTLFPYTRLIRSVDWLPRDKNLLTKLVNGVIRHRLSLDTRSEEHTSELQSRLHLVWRLFFFNDTATTEIYTLSLHEAHPICRLVAARQKPPYEISKRRYSSSLIPRY